MPWRNLGELLKELFRHHIDPEEIGVYVPESDQEDEVDDSDQDTQE